MQTSNIHNWESGGHGVYTMILPSEAVVRCFLPWGKPVPILFREHKGLCSIL